MMSRRMKKWGWLMLGLPENSRKPHSSPPPNALDERSDQRQGGAPLAVIAEVLLGKYTDAALARWLQQEGQMAEAV